MNGKFVPYQKLHKKQQRLIDREKRGSWGEINPITKRAERSDAYNRKAENRRWKSEAHKGPETSGGFALLA